MSQETLVVFDQSISFDPRVKADRPLPLPESSGDDSLETISPAEDLEIDLRLEEVKVVTRPSSDTSEWSEKEREGGEITVEESGKWVLAMREKRQRCHQEMSMAVTTPSPFLLPLPLRILLIFPLIYILAICIDLIALGFELLGGKTITNILRNGEILHNPLVSLMVGSLTMTLLQDPLICISLIASIISIGVADAQIGVFLMMGLNIGTSFPIHLASLGRIDQPEGFGHVFGSVVILDGFNWITSLILIGIESLTGLLFSTSKMIIGTLDSSSGEIEPPFGQLKLFKSLTKPLIDLILKVDNRVLNCWAEDNCPEETDSSLALTKQFCSMRNSTIEVIHLLSDSDGKVTHQETQEIIQEIPIRCNFLMAMTNFSDPSIGIILLIFSFFIFYLAQSLLCHNLKGFKGFGTLKLNSEDSGIKGFFLIAVGATLTLIFQSAKTLLCILLPLMRNFESSLKYPLILGASSTSLIASLLSQGSEFNEESPHFYQMAFIYILFNLLGLLLLYPVSFLRVPLRIGNFLGKYAEKYRWFPLAYLLLQFILLPLLILGLALAGNGFVILVVLLLLLLGLFIGLVNSLQKSQPGLLPKVLRSWEWLPKPSLCNDFLCKRSSK